MAKKKIIRKFYKKNTPGTPPGNSSQQTPNENQGINNSGPSNQNRFRPHQRNDNPRNESNPNNKDNPNKRRSFYNREKPERKDRYENQQQSKTERPERREKVLLGKCYLCQANISDDIYGLKTKNGEYIHFECMVKHAKNVARDEFSQRDIKVYYTGSGNFSLVLEKKIKGTIKWEVLKTINIKQLEETEKTTN